MGGNTSYGCRPVGKNVERCFRGSWRLEWDVLIEVLTVYTRRSAATPCLICLSVVEMKEGMLWNVTKCFAVFEKKEMSNVWLRTSCWRTVTEMQDIWKLIFGRAYCMSASGHIFVNCMQISRLWWNIFWQLQWFSDPPVRLLTEFQATWRTVIQITLTISYLFPMSRYSWNFRQPERR